MIIEETKKTALEIFKEWFPLFAKDLESDNEERLFEYFHSGYIAGTKHGNLTGEESKEHPHSIIIDDINRNLNI